MDLASLTQDAQNAPQIDFARELEETEKSLKEVALLIEQSESEINKLTQRQAAITAHLEQIQSRLDRVSSSEIQMAYDSALDAQQRLLTMRGHLEKLQSDRAHLENLRNILQAAQAAVAAPQRGAAASDHVTNSVEMLVNAQEAERQRLSRQMHDGPAQALSNFILQAEIAARLLDMDTDKARVELDNLKTSAMKTFQQVRTFIFELRPMMLDDLGLIPTLKRYVENFKEQTGQEVHLTISGQERRLQSYVEVLVFRAIQELLDNAVRHSGATTIKVQITLSDDTFRVSVDDDGKGFDVSAVGQGNSLGLKLMRERIEMLGGKFEIDSVIGKGTRVSFELPALE